MPSFPILRTMAASHVSNLSAVGPYNHGTSASGNLLTHIFGGQTVVSVGQGARNCWLNSFWSCGYTGTSGQRLDSSSVPVAHDKVGLAGNTISTGYKTTFLIQWNAQKSWSKELSLQSHLHLCNVSLCGTMKIQAVSLSLLLFLSTAFSILKD